MVSHLFVEVGVHSHPSGNYNSPGELVGGWNLGIPIQIFVKLESYASLKQQQKTTANDYYSQGIAFVNQEDYHTALVSFD